MDTQLMTIADVILYHIEQAQEATACNEPKQAQMHDEMAKVLLKRLGR